MVHNPLMKYRQQASLRCWEVLGSTGYRRHKQSSQLAYSISLWLCLQLSNPARLQLRKRKFDLMSHELNGISVEHHSRNNNTVVRSCIINSRLKLFLFWNESCGSETARVLARKQPPQWLTPFFPHIFSRHPISYFSGFPLAGPSPNKEACHVSIFEIS